MREGATSCAAEHTMEEVLGAINEGRMIEAFGTGTAVIVSPVEAIGCGRARNGGWRHGVLTRHLHDHSCRMSSFEHSRRNHSNKSVKLSSFCDR